MARQLWLLRHAEAEPQGEGGDFDRRLTSRGETQSRVAGAALARLDVRLAAVLTSPRVRARETAALVCEALELEPAVHEPLSGGFGGQEALDLLAEQDDDARVLIVGHEPDLSETVRELTGARIDLKKAGVAAVRLDDGDAELIALLRPRELELLAADAG